MAFPSCSDGDTMSNAQLPRFLQLSSALQQFVTVEGTQSQLHIRPLHQYLTVRLVLESSFDPEEITPHPPLRVESKDARKLLNFAPEVDPGLVYGFLHFLKANRQGEAQLAPNDIALTAAGEPVAAIRRYHDVLLGLAGRRLVRNDYTRYEAVGLAMVVPHGETRNQLLAAFPQRLEEFGKVERAGRRYS